VGAVNGKSIGKLENYGRTSEKKTMKNIKKYVKLYKL
jgi:hypothetical protein